MRTLFELAPLLAFFVTLVKFDLFVATGVFLVAMPLQMACMWLVYKKIEMMHIFALVIALLLGGITLLLRDPIFIKWKPTVVNWLFSGILCGGQWFTQNPPIKRLLSKQLELPSAVWSTLNMSWAVFFFLLGVLNLYFAYSFDTLTWAKFKVFGSLGLTLVFVIGQAIFLSRHTAALTASSRPKNLDLVVKPRGDEEVSASKVQDA